jgi:tetratricopeptide (TPR) repeat protein
VKPGATPKEVRDAFYEISRRMHPDRFFKKNIGSFRARIEHVYRKLSAAHETLTDDTKRAAYLKANPSLLDAEPVRAVAAAAPKEAPKPHSAEDEAREAERRARFAKHPYFAKAARLKELIGRAREHMANGEWGHAFTDLHMASQVDATNEEVKKLLAEVRGKTEIHRADGEVKRGLELYEQGNEHGALAAFKTASNIDNRNAKAAYMAAKLMWDKSQDTKDVLPFAQRAVENAPKNPDYHLLVARIMEHAGMKALAKKHFEEVLKLDPNNAEAKKHVKGRWPF